MVDPEKFCQKCSYPWGIADESCQNCGFDPVGDEDDAKAYEGAIAAYGEWKESQHEH